MPRIYCLCLIIFFALPVKAQLDTTGLFPGIRLINFPVPSFTSMFSANLNYKISSDLLLISEFGIDYTKVLEPKPNADYKYFGMYGKAGVGVFLHEAVVVSAKIVYSEYNASYIVHFEGDYWGDFDEEVDAGKYAQLGAETAIDIYIPFSDKLYFNSGITANTPFSPRIKSDFRKLSRYYRPGYNWFVLSTHIGINIFLDI